MQAGRIVGKLRESADWPAAMLDLLSRAAWLAQLQGGFIEPLYQLHTARLKLLLALQRGELSGLQLDCRLLATHPFELQLAQRLEAPRAVRVTCVTLATVKLTLLRRCCNAGLHIETFGFTFLRCSSKLLAANPAS